MRILALDTATSGCSAAVWADGTVLARRLARMPRGQSEALMPMVEAVIAEAGGGYAALDLIAVTHGPGAFTGLRIGLAAARGIALAAGLPCLGVGTLEAVARGVDPANRSAVPLLVALDAKRADLYVQLFGPDGRPATAPAAMMPADLPGLVGGAAAVDIVGDAAEPARASLAAAGVAARRIDAPVVPDAAVVAAIAAEAWRPGQAAPPPEPLYLRPPDVTLSRRPARRRS